MQLVFSVCGEQIKPVVPRGAEQRLKRKFGVIAMFSLRFQRKIIVTRHARERMVERVISDEMLLEVIDKGQTRYRDDTHLWAFMEFPERADNLLCAVLVLEDAVVVKTVMHHFSVL